MAVAFLFLILFSIAQVAHGAEIPSELENPCDILPSLKPCEKEGGPQRYFYNPKANRCTATSHCHDAGAKAGFRSLDLCRAECEKSRATRKIADEHKYEVISDLEISPPKKLSSITKRRFPLVLCNLPWDSGLVCPEVHRGSYLDQFHYDPQTNSCQHFVYNGCGGNANRFFSLWECIQACVRKRYLG